MDETTIPYKREGDYMIPDLELKPQASIGRYGRLRMDFLKEHRPALYSKIGFTITAPRSKRPLWPGLI